MRRGDQYCMFCACGQARPVRAGLCGPCYRARQHSRAAFAGQRDVVLDWDRRTFAQLAHKGQAPLEQIQLSLGHASIQTTERYLGVQQDLQNAPCDHLGLRVGNG